MQEPLYISHKYKFIFIQIPKTGTSSIKAVLNPFIEGNTFDAIRHADYAEIARSYPNQLIEYFKFSFVRNPWDRIVSYYFFQKKRGKINNKLTFEDFLLAPGGSVVKPQCDWVHQLNSYSFVGRFENFQEDFDIVCEKIGIPRKELPHENETKHKHYTEYYNDKMREIVAKKCAKDIEYFGYEFQ